MNKTPKKPFDPTKPCKTRDGRTARVLGHGLELDGKDESIVALVDGDIEVYFEDGRYIASEDSNNYDLVNLPTERIEFRRARKDRVHFSCRGFMDLGMLREAYKAAPPLTLNQYPHIFKLTYLDGELARAERVE